MTVYATEVTDFRNVSAEIKNKPEVYYSDFLTAEMYTSIDNYLLTHEGPFWGTGTEAGPTNPIEMGMTPVLEQGTEATQDNATGSTDETSAEGSDSSAG
jgi:hypothetical protein